MTEVEWLTCGDRSRMRSVIKSRPYSPRKWVMFDIACLDRIRGFFEDARFVRYLGKLDEFADSTGSLWPPSFPHESAAVREACRSFAHGDPLRAAKIAAVRGLLEAGRQNLGVSELAAVAVGRRDVGGGYHAEKRAHCTLLRDIFGNPFRTVTLGPAWRTDTAVSLARVMYETRDFTGMPILADALQDAGCEHADILDHCRGDSPHVRGCWVVDLVLGK